MRVTQRTQDMLVIEEDAGMAIFIGSICLGLGAISVIIGWTNEMAGRDRRHRVCALRAQDFPAQSDENA